MKESKRAKKQLIVAMSNEIEKSGKKAKDYSDSELLRLFVKKGLTENGCNFDDAVIKIEKIIGLIQTSSNKETVKKFETFKNLYEDLFILNNQVKNVGGIKESPAFIKYQREGEDFYRCVAVGTVEQKQTPVIYVNFYKENAIIDETRIGNTFLEIKPNELSFKTHDEVIWMGEQSVYANGVMSDFIFDNQNNIKEIRVKELHPNLGRVGLWGDTHVFIQQGYDLIDTTGETKNEKEERELDELIDNINEMSMQGLLDSHSNKNFNAISGPKKKYDDTKHLYSTRNPELKGIKSRFPIEDDFGRSL